MAAVNSPNMTLPIPAVGSTPGPDYALDVNSSLTLIDQHDHSPGKGVQITPAGLNINTSLSLQNNALIDIKELILTEQPSISDLQAIYSAPGGESPSINDLFYNDSAGNVIQITKAGTVNATIGSIPGESYSTGTFTWTQTQDSLPTTPANFDIGSITIRPNVALTTFGVTLAPPSSISSAYTLNLPLVPASTSFLTIPNTGAISSAISYPITSKGDLMVGTSSVNLARLGAGSDGQVVTADSTATNGLSYQNSTNSLIATKTSNYTLTGADSTILADASGGAFSLTLPAASSVLQHKFLLKRTDNTLANVVSIIGTIDGATNYSLTTIGEVLEIQSNGTVYTVVGRETDTAWISAGTITVTATTTNPTKGTTTADALQWRRQGNSAIINVSYRQTSAGTAGSGDYLFALPTSMSIDTGVIPVFTTSVGTALLSVASAFPSAIQTSGAGVGSQTQVGYNAFAYSTTQFRVSMLGATPAVLAFASNSQNFTTSSLAFNFTVTVPILGWKA